LLLKDEFSEKSGALAGVCVLAIGIALGLVISPGAWLEGLEAPHETERATSAEDLSSLAPKGVAGDRPTNDLETIDILLDAAAMGILREEQRRAMATGAIVRTDASLVPVTIRHDGQEYSARVRLKGDLIDHVDSSRWSLRIELTDKPLFGMSRFSIQHPKTRHYLPGYLVLEAARYQGLLAPRASFVNVEINGNSNGIYELEEHISKELLESQGRRDGPVLLFNEASFWSLAAQVKSATPRQGPSRRVPGDHVLNAEVSVFGGRHLAGSEDLSRQLQSGFSKLRDLQRLMILRSRWSDILSSLPLDLRTARQVEAHRFIFERHADGATADLPLQLQAAPEVVASNISGILAVERMAKATALLSLFGGSHGLAWHNTRFYLDPTRDRFELVIFDINPSITHGWTADPLVWDQRWIGNLLKDLPDYYLGIFKELHELTDPGWLDAFLAALEPDLTRYGDALTAAGDLPPGEDLASVRTHLQNRQLYLRTLLAPSDCAHFHSFILADGDELGSEMVIEAWVATRVPVALDGFRFSNGRLQPAAQVLDPAMMGGAVVIGDAVILPWDARRVRFRFPLDERIATLREIAQITDAILQETERDRSARLEITAEFHLIGSGEKRSELLRTHRFQRAWSAEGLRPVPPSIEDALELHPFLRYEVDSGKLFVAQGSWDVGGDLVVPAGHILRAGPGVTLRFEEGAILYSESALSFLGVEGEPVRLEPIHPAKGWAGVVVLDARERTVWFHVHVSGASELRRGGWLASGGVNFYHCPVEIRSSTISDARGEDALNVLGAEVLLDEVRFVDTASDALDGDFVHGLVRRCEFVRIGGDAVDTSGSRVHVDRCTFREVHDKAISAGESSEVTITDGIVHSASIGIASKDGSTITVRGLKILSATQYGMTAYIKKPGYPPSRITAEGVVITESGLGAHLVQTGCTLLIDGVEQPTQAIDVGALYEQGILGN
jgi:hypothetical protein